MFLKYYINITFPCNWAATHEDVFGIGATLVPWDYLLIPVKVLYHISSEQDMMSSFK
jgi:hypothetical protein